MAYKLKCQYRDSGVLEQAWSRQTVARSIIFFGGGSECVTGNMFIFL